MNRSKLAALSLLAATTSCNAWEIRTRWVERVGTTDTVLIGDEIIDKGWGTRRVRLQMGVFDDAQGPAPVGGLYGWTSGEVTTLDWLARRTPGRLGVFVMPAGANGFPATDPFFEITQVEGTVGNQTIAWNCNGAIPLPMPPAVVRGRNTFVSVWEVTLSPGRCGNSARDLVISGSIVAAAGWTVQGTPVPPVCADPTIPGSVVYEPTLLAPVAFTARLWAHNHGYPPPPPCGSDWDRSGARTSTDFFEFIADFFTGTADFDCDGTVNSADVFAFLSEFFQPC